MKITKISYSKTVESCIMGAGIWQKLGVEIDVEPGDEVHGVIDRANEVVETALKKYLPEPPTGDLYFNVSKNKEERG